MDLLRGATQFHLSPILWDGKNDVVLSDSNPDEALNSGMFAYFSPNPHKDGVPSAYAAVIITSDSSLEKKVEAWGDYGVLPQFVCGRFLMFRFEKYLTPEQYKIWSEAIAFAWEGNLVNAFPFSLPGIEGLPFKESTFQSLEDLSNSVRLIKTENARTLGLTTSNADIAERFQEFDIIEIACKTGVSGFKVDKGMNVVSWPREYVGHPFFHVMRRLSGDLHDTMVWFNQNMSATFIPSPEDFKAITDGSGYKIESGRTFRICSDGYVCTAPGPGGAPKEIKMCDFHVIAMYKVLGINGKLSNWVKLVNPITGDETPEIEFPSESGKTAFTNFLLEYNLSFFGSANNIIDLHQHISRAPVPKITKVIGLGFKKDGLFLANGVWDKKKRELSRKVGKFWFSPDGRGFSCETQTGNPVEDLKKLPEFPLEIPEVVPKPEQVVSTLADLYNGDVGMRAAAWLYGVMGFGVFRPHGSCPLMSVYGVKGSGKTELHRLLYRAFGYKNAYGFDPTTMFAMRMAFSHFDCIPVFLSEYRRSVPHHEQKTELLRSAYDRTGFSHGTAELKLISYDFTCIPSIEGEEMISDPAVRSRGFQIFLSKQNQKEGFVAKARDQNIDLNLVSFLKNYNDNEAFYLSKMAEGRNLVPGAEARVRDNCGVLFAGCMVAAPALEEQWKKVISDMGKEVANDMDSSSGVKEFINKIGMYAPQMFDVLTVKHDEAFFDVGKLIQFFQSRRVKMNLDAETYVQYATQAGYEVGYYECGESMVYAMKVKIHNGMDKAFLTIPEIYNVFKQRFLKKD